MPTGGSAEGPTGHLVPTGGSIEDYVSRGIEEAQRVVDSNARLKPAVTAYTRQVIAPAAKAAYEAARPVAEQLVNRGHEGRRLWEAVDDLRALPATVGHQLMRSVTGEDPRTPPEIATRKTLEQLAALKRAMQTLSWQHPAQLAAAVEKVTELEEALQWEAIESKVFQ